MNEGRSDFAHCCVLQIVFLVVVGGVVLDCSAAFELLRVAELVAESINIFLYGVESCVQGHRCGEVCFFVTFAYCALREELVVVARSIEIVVDGQQ